MGLRQPPTSQPETVIHLRSQSVCPPADPSLPHSPSAELQCCPGWRQKDQECTIPICEGLDACREDEVCVKPGLCRCKPGFFGAQCNSRES
ncbi:scavenger receptor class f member 1 [Lynx pardinus]|uniref:Scavenger receptor class f member 1 n=1 Tax=Lynx pardinus TaxID=191816 RepID=A0A485N564_LYNPA|nr:scavenger receptor class f member 1 [Lynx pardinus]